jgi:hypothetical protein
MNKIRVLKKITRGNVMKADLGKPRRIKATALNNTM